MQMFSILERYDKYRTIAFYSVKPILELVQPFAIINIHAGGKTHKVKLQSVRLQTFKKSNVCCCCGVVGSIFALQNERCEKSSTPYHLNLYGFTDDGLILMTKDHIIPKSKGGQDCLNNMRTMCAKCNVARGNLPIPLDVLNECIKKGIDNPRSLAHTPEVKQFIQEERILGRWRYRLQAARNSGKVPARFLTTERSVV